MRRSTAGTELRLTVLPARYIDTVITLTVVILTMPGVSAVPYAMRKVPLGSETVPYQRAAVPPVLRAGIAAVSFPRAVLPQGRI